MEILRFYKEDNKRWYADVPQWTGRKGALQMVAGADKLLDSIAKEKTEVYLHFSEKKINSADKLVLIKKCWWNGADYRVQKFGQVNLERKVWLCDVTKFVIGYFPKEIYYKEVDYNEEI